MLRRWLIPVVTVMLLAGCANQEPTPSAGGNDLFFPRHGSPLGAGDAALLEGDLLFVDGCLLIEAGEGTRALVLWPVDTEPGVINGQPVILGPRRELLAEAGSSIRLGGSAVVGRRLAEELVGAIPERCVSGDFWGVSTVESRP